MTFFHGSRSLVAIAPTLGIKHLACSGMEKPSAFHLRDGCLRSSSIFLLRPTETPVLPNRIDSYIQTEITTCCLTHVITPPRHLFLPWFCHVTPPGQPVYVGCFFSVPDGPFSSTAHSIQGSLRAPS